MVSNITLLESRFDLRLNRVEKRLSEAVEGKSDDVINAIRNNIISGTKHSISSKCAKYEMLKDNEVWSDSGKKLKKELSDDIGLFKKLNEQNIDRLNDEIDSLDFKITNLKNKILDLKDEISVLKNNINCYSIFKKLIELFPSIYNIVCEKVNKIKDISIKYEVISKKYDKLNNLYRSRIRIIEEIEYTDKIEKRIIEKQSKKIKIWKPKEIIKESLIDRIKSFKNLDHLIPLIESSGFKDKNFGESREIILCNGLHLIVTSKNNCYLVLKQKDAIIGEGTSKVVYQGIDLSKNKPIAVAYADDNLSEEERIYLDLRKNSKNETIKIKDHLISRNGKCIFISDLYVKGSLFHDLKSEKSEVKKDKNKTQFCKKLIKIIRSMCKKGFFLGDLKPENIVIDGELHPRICDLDKESFSRFTLAPECFQQGIKPFYNEQTCVWSLGANLYEIYCGRFIKDVFQANNRRPIIMKELSYRIHELNDKMIDNLFNEKIKNAREKDRPFLRIIREMLRMSPDARLSLDNVDAAWE